MTDFKILWVDDDMLLAESLPLDAENYNLNLVHFPDWESAEVALLSDYDSWNAIILDAKCRFSSRQDDSFTAVSFLSGITTRLAVIAAQHGFKPWYVLSGGSAAGIGGIEEVLNNNPRIWDDWPALYYNKEEYEVLFERIRAYCLSHMPAAMRIREEKFKDVFDAIRRSGLDGVEQALLQVLMSAESTTWDNGVAGSFMDVRIVIQNVFRALIKRGDLPDFLFTSKGVNIAWSSLVMAGEREEMSPDLLAHEREFENCRIYRDRLFPKILAMNVKTMILSGNSRGHGSEDVNTRRGTRPYDLKEYKGSITPSPYLLRSYALQLCDLVLWYDKFVAQDDSSE